MKILHLFPFLGFLYLAYEQYGPPATVINTITVTGPSTGSPFPTSVDVRLHKNGTLTWRRPNQLELPAAPTTHDPMVIPTTTNENE